MIILRLWELYIWIFLSVSLHELFHLATAALFRIKVRSMKLGASLFAIKIGNVSISPIAANGFTEVEKNELYRVNESKLILFFLSGLVANILLIFIMLLFFKGYLLRPYIIGLNLCLLFSSALPVFSRSDVKQAIVCLKERKSIRETKSVASASSCR